MEGEETYRSFGLNNLFAFHFFFFLYHANEEQRSNAWSGVRRLRTFTTRDSFTAGQWPGGGGEEGLVMLFYINPLISV